jgi:hypothetical protein
VPSATAAFGGGVAPPTIAPPDDAGGRTTPDRRRTLALAVGGAGVLVAVLAGVLLTRGPSEDVPVEPQVARNDSTIAPTPTAIPSPPSTPVPSPTPTPSPPEQPSGVRVARRGGVVPAPPVVPPTASSPTSHAVEIERMGDRLAALVDRDDRDGVRRVAAELEALLPRLESPDDLFWANLRLFDARAFNGDARAACASLAEAQRRARRKDQRDALARERELAPDC